MKLLALLMTLFLTAPAIVAAGEHPKEHPTSKQEHPKKKKRKKKKKKWVKHRKTMRAFTQAIEDYVLQKEEEEGAFKVYDKRRDRTWRLTLDRIHRKRIVRLGDDEFFACADFKQIGGKNKLDLDFFVSRSDGEFIVDKVQVHKVNGKARYTYNSRNEQVPVRASKKKKRKKKRGKKKKLKLHEHPTGGNEHPTSGGNKQPTSGGGEHPASGGGEHPR